MNDKPLCVFCNAPYTDKMVDVLNGSYGCESGCDYMTFIVFCESCKRAVYIKGEFGYYDDDEEKREYISNVSQEEIEQALKEKVEERLRNHERKTQIH